MKLGFPLRTLRGKGAHSIRNERANTMVCFLGRLDTPGQFYGDSKFGGCTVDQIDFWLAQIDFSPDQMYMYI